MLDLKKKKKKIYYYEIKIDNIRYIHVLDDNFDRK